MNIDLTPILQAIIALLAALITYKLIPWLRTKTTAQQRADLVAAARIAVYAAEQIYGTAKDANDAKLEYALNRLREGGFDLSTPALRSAIEAAVYDIKGKIVTDYLIPAGEEEPEPEENDTPDDEPQEAED